MFKSITVLINREWHMYSSVNYAIIPTNAFILLLTFQNTIIKCSCKQWIWKCRLQTGGHLSWPQCGFFSRWIHILTNVTPLLLTLYLYIYRSLQSFTSSFKMPHGKWFLIRSKMTGYVLDVFEGNKSPGARVSVWEENGGENQLFCYHNATNTIRNKMNWFCLDAVGKHIQLTEFINSIRFNAIRNRIHLPWVGR